MKKYLLIILLFLNSCTFYLYNTTCKIENNSSHSVQIKVFANIYRDSVNIVNKGIDTLYSVLETEIIKPFDLYDSVFFAFSNDTIIKYYPSDTLKNKKSFFREEDWSVEKKRRQTIIYRFTITDDDLK